MKKKKIKLPPLSSYFIEAIELALEQGHVQTIHEILEPLYEEDIADILEDLERDYRRQLYDILKNKISFSLLISLNPAIRHEVLHALEDDYLRTILRGIRSDQLIVLLKDLSRSRQEEILSLLDKETQSKIRHTLAYPENSAGQLMQQEFVYVSPLWTVDKTLNYLRMLDNPGPYRDIFVLDKNLRPLGNLTLTQLIKAPLTATVEEIMDSSITLIPVGLDQEEVAFFFKQYHFSSAAVVNEHGQMIGKITLKQILKVIEEEAQEDIYALGGVVHPVTLKTSVKETIGYRMRWLLVTFFDTLLASIVISQFSDTLSKNVSLAILMPIVAAMGGNAGMQVVTVVVRSLATRDFRIVGMSRLLRKELLISGINGLFFAIILSSIASFWFHDEKLGLILGASMIFNIIWGGVAGLFLPVILSKMKFDPAIGAGPLLTTTTDVLGFSIFLGLAKLFLF